MKNYENYSLDDFLEDEEFRHWVQGEDTHNSFWVTFPHQYPKKEILMREAEILLRATHVKHENISDKEVRSEVEKYLDRISNLNRPDDSIELLPNELKFYHVLKQYKWPISIVATIILMIGLNWYWQAQNQLPGKIADLSVNKNNLVKTSNNTEKSLEIIMVDGSKVTLSPMSSLSYPTRFADSVRIVHLEGEAHFCVKQQDKPFMVMTGKVVTKVLGTRFVVRAFDQDKKITVQVETGKVYVSMFEPKNKKENKDTKGLIITANQSAIFEKSINQLSKSLVNTPISIKSESRQQIKKYEEVPLPVIFEELENTYGIPIQYNLLNFQNCRLTANLSNEDMYEQLNILCKAVSAQYEIVDGQIVISGKGCE